MLNITQRPKELNELIGQDSIVNAIEAQFKSGRVPHFYLISGASGTGKTTLSRILARKIDKDADIFEINASDKNGVDDIRSLIESSKNKSIKSKPKVIIMDEAHQLTSAAQAALLKPTEDTPEHIYYIFCTSNPAKIDKQIKRRAYEIRMNEFDPVSIRILLESLKQKVSSGLAIEPLLESLIKFEITSPGFIVQAADKYFNGVSADSCIIVGGTSSNIDTKKLCQSVAKGSWKDSADILSLIKKEDIIMIRAMILGYLKAILLKSSGEKALKISKAITTIGTYSDDLPVFLANICLGSSYLQ
jgi:DNA polymerase III subunit gamma/tau